MACVVSKLTYILLIYLQDLFCAERQVLPGLSYSASIDLTAAAADLWEFEDNAISTIGVSQEMNSCLSLWSLFTNLSL